MTEPRPLEARTEDLELSAIPSTAPLAKSLTPTGVGLLCYLLYICRAELACDVSLADGVVLDMI